MDTTTGKDAARAAQREALRRQLLKLIVKNEAQRRGRLGASDK